MQRTYTAIEPGAAHFATGFTDTAVRLLRAEQNNNTIDLIASLFCLTVSSICSGDDAMAKTFHRQYLQMAVTLRLHGDNSAAYDELGLDTPESIRAYSYVAWGSYNFAW